MLCRCSFFTIFGYFFQKNTVFLRKKDCTKLPMEIYTGFAKVYSGIMKDIPYAKWEKYIAKTLKEFQIRDGLVLDLGCGTGEMTRRLKYRGYDMIGVDFSPEMLQAAGEEDSEGILYLLQDMREFELYGTVRAIVSVCDSMNYMTDEEDFVEVLRLANNYLDPGGIFIFDLKTVHFFRDVMGENCFGENLENCSYFWENGFDREEKINRYDLTIFQKEKDFYRKFEETHFQKAYTVSQIRKMVSKSGMELVRILDADDYKPVSRKSERIYVIARESGKDRN